MKISIITVVFNNKDFIEGAIKSVLSQTHKDIEYIIVDGGSTDGTVGIIKKYSDKLAKFISEKDNGIYDAMNKGLKVATGDIIGILNSDDFYAEGKILEVVADKMEKSQVDCLWGDLVFVDRNNIGKVVRTWKSSDYREGKFKKGWHPAHPTFFVKKEIYDKYGMFNLKFKIAADYEVMLRFLEKYKISSFYLPEVLVKMRVGGASNKSLFSIFKANWESYKAWKVNGLSGGRRAIFLKPLSKIIQLFRA